MFSTTITATQEQLETWVRLGLLQVTRQTKDGRVKEYTLTHAGRTLASQPKER